MREVPNRKRTGKPSYALDELLSQADFTTPRTEEEQAWLDMVPVGREFGSAEFDALERRAEVEISQIHNSEEERASVKFELMGEELQKYQSWEAEHNETCPYYDDGSSPAPKIGAIGGRTTFSFTPTGVGTVVVVKCACGEEINVTDFDHW